MVPQSAARQLRPAVRQPAELGLGIAHRPGERRGRRDGRLVAGGRASADVVAETLVIERQAGGSLRGGAVPQQGLAGAGGVAHPVAVARGLRGDLGQEQGQGLGVQRLLGAGEEGHQEGQIAPQVAQPDAVHQVIVIGDQPLRQARLVLHREVSGAQVLQQQVDIERQAVGAGDHALDEGVTDARTGVVLIAGDQGVTGVRQSVQQHGADVGRRHGREPGRK